MIMEMQKPISHGALRVFNTNEVLFIERERDWIYWLDDVASNIT